MLESDGISDDVSDWGSDFDEDVEDDKVKYISFIIFNQFAHADWDYYCILNGTEAKRYGVVI